MSDSEKFELSVLCCEQTDVRKDIYVEGREWFVPGVVHLCLKCAKVAFTDLGSKLKQKQLRIHAVVLWLTQIR